MEQPQLVLNHARRLGLLTIVVMLAAAMSLAWQAEQDDHIHLQLALEVAPSQPRPSGDAVGIYAVEVFACNADKASLPGGRVADWLSRASDLLISSAWANHRERFDGQGAKVVMVRVPLDRADRISLADVAVAKGRYCRVRLTFARLPSVTQPTPLPPLNTSVRLTRPGNLSGVALNYAVPFVLSLAPPWQADGQAASLTIKLDPASANDLLADANIDKGRIAQRVMARWVETSKVTVTP